MTRESRLAEIRSIVHAKKKVHAVDVAWLVQLVESHRRVLRQIASYDGPELEAVRNQAREELG